MWTDRKHSGFALVEAAALLVVGGVVAALLLLAAGDQRRLARLGEDLGKLREIGAATGTYAADHADLFWSLSWQGGITYNTPWPELNFAATDLQAQANQAVSIIRRIGGDPAAPPLTAWIASIQYSHLPLAEHLGAPVPWEWAISSADRLRLQWARNPTGTGAGPHGPYPCGTPGISIHCSTLPRSASFRLVVAAYDRSGVGRRINQAAQHNQWIVPSGTELSGLTTSAAAFPSQKVLVSDWASRHYGGGYSTHEQARLPLLFVDGSVLVKSAVEANKGWSPNAPGSLQPATYNYCPAAYEPPTFSGAACELVTGRWWWTRCGMEGRDFGGPEVCLPPP